MTLFPGDEIVGEDGQRFELGPMVAYRGREGCENWSCTRREPPPGACYGWHCSLCDAPTNMYGHKCPREADRAR